MMRLQIIILGLLLLGSSIAQAREEQLLSPAQLLELYGDASDELSTTEAQELILMLCNTERRSHGLTALEPLGLASFAARRHANEMARLGYSSHYDAEGRDPLERYNRLGGTDYVQENLIFLEIDWPLLLTERLVRSFHREWLDSPRHLRTMLSPQATHLGSSFELQKAGGTYRMAGVCEFVSEWGDYARLPHTATVTGTLELSGQLRKGVEAGYIGIGLKPHSCPMDAAELNELPPYYSLPEEIEQVPLQQEIREIALDQTLQLAYRDLGPAGSYRIELEIPEEWRGQTVYFYVFAIPAGDAEMRCVSGQTVIIES